MASQLQLALLRGINLGKVNRIGMADLRDLFLSVGYSDVRTVIASGNVIFHGPKATSAKLERAFQERFGFHSSMAVLDATSVLAVIEQNTLLPHMTNASRMFGVVLNGRAPAGVQELVQRDWGEERMSLGDHAVYLWCPAGLLDSRLNKELQKLLKDAGTARNWATLTKIAAHFVAAK